MNDMQVCGSADQILCHLKNLLVEKMKMCADLCDPYEEWGPYCAIERSFNLHGDWVCRFLGGVRDFRCKIEWQIHYAGGVSNGGSSWGNSITVRNTKELIECSKRIIEKDAIKIIGVLRLSNMPDRFVSSIEFCDIYDENPATAPCRSNSL